MGKVVGWHSAAMSHHTDSTLLSDSLKRSLFLPAFEEVSGHFGRPTGQGTESRFQPTASQKPGPSVPCTHTLFHCAFALLHFTGVAFFKIKIIINWRQDHLPAKGLQLALLWWSGTRLPISLRCAHSLKGMSSANTWVSLEVDSSPSGLWMRPVQLTSWFPALWDPQWRIQWSCAQTPNLEKLWDN